MRIITASLGLIWVAVAFNIAARAAPFPHAHRTPWYSHRSAHADITRRNFGFGFGLGWNKSKRQDTGLGVIILTETETRTVTALETVTDVETAFQVATPTVVPTLPLPTPAKGAVQFVGDAPVVADAESVLFLPDVSVQVGVSVPQSASSTTTTTTSAAADGAVTGSVTTATTTAATASDTGDAPSSSDTLAGENSTISAGSGASSTDDSDGAFATEAPLPLPLPPLSTPPSAPSSSASADPNSDSNSPDPDATPPAIAATPPPLQGPLIAAYYPDWVSDTLPPEAIDFSRLDWVDFAFGVPDAKFGIGWDDGAKTTALLARLVKAAHAKKTKVKLSLGGWGGSKYFSPAVASPSSRQTFAKNIAAVYKQYALDGIDIDWEYPGQQGAGSNVVNAQDSANFLVFLRLLRTTLPSGARITAAVQDVPFADASGRPMRDVSAFAGVLDWVNLMNYDVWSASKTPGPNAPLSDACGNSTQPGMNAAGAVNAWTAAKFPASKLVLGVPAYGYLSPSSKTTLRQRRDATAPATSSPSGDPSSSDDGVEDGDGDPDSGPSMTFQYDSASRASTASPSPSPSPKTIVTLKDSDGNTSGGQIQFASVLSQGALIAANSTSTSTSTSASSSNSTSRESLAASDAGDPPEFVGYGGFTRFWDTCSSTPFLVSQYTNQVVTYDDPQSLGLKASFARRAGLLGVAVWDLSGDTKEGNLLAALARGLGK